MTNKKRSLNNFLLFWPMKLKLQTKLFLKSYKKPCQCHFWHSSIKLSEFALILTTFDHFAKCVISLVTSVVFLVVCSDTYVVNSNILVAFVLCIFWIHHGWPWLPGNSLGTSYPSWPRLHNSSRSSTNLQRLWGAPTSQHWWCDCNTGLYHHR